MKKLVWIVGIAWFGVLLSGCAELRELRQIKQIQETRIRELEKQNNDYKDAYYELKIHRGKEQFESKKKIDKLERDISDLEESRSEKEQKLREENISLRRELQTASSQLNTARLELKKLKEKHDLLKTDTTNALKQKESNLEKAEQDKNSLLLETSTLKSDFDSATQQLSAKQEEIQNLQNQLGERDKQVKTLESQVSKLEEKIKNSPDVSEKTGEQTTDSKILDEAESVFKEEIQEVISAGKVRVKQDDRGLVLHLYSDDLFEAGSVILTKEVRPLLIKISGILTQFPNQEIFVEGHTDNVPIENLPFLDNLALSSARADNVLRFLVENGGVDRKRVKSIACSWFHPLASNDTAEGRKNNRRVEIILRP